MRIRCRASGMHFAVIPVAARSGLKTRFFGEGLVAGLADSGPAMA
jgi:hypothetical protein